MTISRWYMKSPTLRIQVWITILLLRTCLTCTVLSFKRWTLSWFALWFLPKGGNSIVIKKNSNSHYLIYMWLFFEKK